MEHKIVLSGITVPVMTREQFARAIGVERGVVDGWCDRGYLPTIRIGKYSPVTLLLLVKPFATEAVQSSL